MRKPWPRAAAHDTIAVPAVRRVFEQHGFTAHLMGTEGDPDALRAALRGQKDRTALLLRFRPDQTFVKPGLGAVLCEIKTEPGGHHNYAVEADSYHAAMRWSAAESRVVVVFADLGVTPETLLACWVDELPGPHRIRVPDRWDYRESMERLKTTFPDAALVVETYRYAGPGSGTPYFLVSKGLRALRPLPDFIRQELQKGAG
jgi:hypothetical protein